MHSNGNGKSSTMLEREAEETRAQLSATLDELRFRMTPGQVVDQFVEYARDSGGGDFVRNLGKQVMDNPLPVLLMGAGLAWLMIGPQGRAGGSSKGDQISGPNPTIRRGTDALNQAARDARAGASNTAGSIGDAVQQARAKSSSYAKQASSSAGDFTNTARDFAKRARQGASGLGEQVSTMSHGASDTMKTMGTRAADTASAVASRVSSAADAAWDGGQRIAGAGYSAAGGTLGRVFKDQPLLVGAMGIAIGAAIAAALPQTDMEREYVGPTSDAFKEQAQRTVQEHYEQIKGAATSAMSTAREEVDQQFDSAEDVVRTAGERVSAAADRAMGAVEKGIQEAKSQIGADSGNKESGASSAKKSPAGPVSTGTVPGRSERA
jgi:hypothetical protein